MAHPAQFRMDRLERNVRLHDLQDLLQCEHMWGLCLSEYDRARFKSSLQRVIEELKLGESSP
jgi:hypothetical protein